MSWEPITIAEQDVREFAEKALEFYSGLDDRGKAMAREVISRAGGIDDASDHGTGASASASDRSGVERLTAMLLAVWEPGTIIAPLYSGEMPRTGGGTVD